MKKFGKLILSFAICFLTALSFIGCAPRLSSTKATSEGVESNGGIIAKYAGYVYFVNGTKENDGTNNNGSVTVGGIYKAKLNDDGSVSVDSDGKPTECSLVVNSLVGFKYGSINIFGNFLYYVTPNNGENSKAEVLYNQTCFMRYDLVTGATQKLFTTSQNSSSETIEYAYYRLNGNLYLMVYEKSITKLTSVKIDSNVTTKVIADNAQSVLFSEHYGDIQVGARNSVCEAFVYFTRSALSTGAVRTGVRVYKVLPDGTREYLISEGKSVSLLTIKADKLVYSYDSKIYASKITEDEQTLGFDSTSVVSDVTYDSVVFVENGDNIALVYYKDNAFSYIELVDGVVSEPNTAKHRQLFAYTATSEIKMVTVSGDYLYYIFSNALYRIKILNIGESEIITQEQISATTCNEISGNMIPEIVDGYAYFFNTTDDETFLYRAKIQPRDENGAVAEVKAAVKFN
ncbi:MAG: DUF5050 domain-containing protein [bacterium]|nr:DUF5050 domain-containing protein [bacterium]